MIGRIADELRDLLGHCVRVGLRKVDLVDDGDQLEVVLDCEVRVRHRLRLDALRGIDDEEGSLAGLERT